MKLEYTTSNGRVKVNFEGSNPVDIFTQIAQFQEVFEETKCGKCGSENLRFVIRTVKGDKYYELRCIDCGAVLAFGLNKGDLLGNMYPKRRAKKNEDGTPGEYLDSHGWLKWNPKTKKNE